MSVADIMREKLNAAFAPAHLVVEDESAKHHGHAGARPEGETHFRVAIVSAAFAGLSRVDRQRRVYAVLELNR
jgi:BolA protein